MYTETRFIILMLTFDPNPVNFEAENKTFCNILTTLSSY